MTTRYRKEPFRDVDRTLAVMGELARAEQTSPEVRRTADSLTRGLDHDKDRNNIATRIWLFLMREIRYLPDPNGTELVQSPVAVRESGHADCDGLATLAASMLSSIGIESGFRVVAWEKEDVYEHVYAIYAPRPGAQLQDWHALDPVGQSPKPGTDTIRVEGVADKAYTLAEHADKHDIDMPNLTGQTPIRALGATRSLAQNGGEDQGSYDFDNPWEFAAYAIERGPDYIEAWRQTNRQPAPGVTDEDLLELLMQAQNQQQQTAGFGNAGTLILGGCAVAAIVYGATP